MDFDEIVVKDSPGLCRCCLSEGCYKDLSTDYTWMGENEIYADMLFECFDISITQHTEGPNGSSRLICEVCITRLRDACNFKKQVLESEKKFVDMVGRGDFKPKVIVLDTTPLKTEPLPGPSEDDCEIEYLDEDADYTDGYRDDEPLQKLQAAGITVSSLSVKGKRGKKRSAESTKPVKAEKKKKAESKASKLKSSKGLQPEGGQRNVKINDKVDVESEDVIKSKEKGRSLKSHEKRSVMKKNVTEVLLNSNVMPFRWLKSSYRCFYCYDIFEEPQDLKSHQTAHEDDETKRKTMNNYWETTVYIDVTNLACKLCSQPQTDVYNLVDHLVEKHKVAYDKDVGMSVTEFKLNNMSVKCLVCNATFRTFGPLLTHTNKDHKGSSPILCEICGQNFKDVHLLRTHVKTIHEMVVSVCSECGERFECRSKLLTHERNFHGKKHKCLVCSETFRSHYKRSQHMASEHKNRPEIKCLHCPKTFVFRSMMMNHLRDAHLKERNHVCTVCGWKAFNTYRLTNHMYKHSGEKNFKCEICDKAFTTKKIMRAHFVRMHVNGRPSVDFSDLAAMAENC